MCESDLTYEDYRALVSVLCSVPGAEQTGRTTHQAKTRFSTHGLHHFNQRELAIEGAPVWLSDAAADLLNRLGYSCAKGNMELLPGETVGAEIGLGWIGFTLAEEPGGRILRLVPGDFVSRGCSLCPQGAHVH